MATIAFINNNFPGTSATFIYKEVLGLKRRGLNIKTYSIRKPKKETIHKESLALFNTTTYLLPVGKKKFVKAHAYFFIRKPFKYVYLLIFLITRKFDNPLRSRLRTFYHFCEGVYLSELLKGEKDIIHIHAHYASHPSTLAMVVSNLLNIPFSFTGHASDIWVDRLFIKEKIKLAKFVIACTRYGKESILKIAGNKFSDKITVVYHGVDIKKFKPIKKSKSEDGIVLLSIGRLSEEKGQKNLIEACRVLQNDRVKFNCIIVGDGPLYHDFIYLIHKYRLKKNVKLVGLVLQEKITDYYSIADVFILPSIRENLPNVLLESLAMGLPVIASNIAGIPELINDKSKGELVRPNDVDDLVRCIKRLSKNKDLLNLYSTEGRKWVCEYFNTEKLLDKLVEIYNKNVLWKQP